MPIRIAELDREKRVASASPRLAVCIRQEYWNMTRPADEHLARQAIEDFYRAFEQKNVALLRRVVTPDWE